MRAYRRVNDQYEFRVDGGRLALLGVGAALVVLLVFLLGVLVGKSLWGGVRTTPPVPLAEIDVAPASGGDDAPAREEPKEPPKPEYTFYEELKKPEPDAAPPEPTAPPAASPEKPPEPKPAATRPAVIMCAIPFGVVGMILGHLVMGRVISFLSLIGFVALTGIVVNDSLILVDFVNRRRQKGNGLIEALVVAGRQRFRPILLTSITTMVGLSPLALFASGQARFLQLPIEGCAAATELYGRVFRPTVHKEIYAWEDLPRAFAEMHHNTQTGIPIVRVADELPEAVKKIT